MWISSVTSCRTRVNFGCFLKALTFAGVPVRKLSTATTLWRSESNRSQRWLPRKPAPPVTTDLGMFEKLLQERSRGALEVRVPEGQLHVGAEPVDLRADVVSPPREPVRVNRLVASEVTQRVRQLDLSVLPGLCLSDRGEDFRRGDVRAGDPEPRGRLFRRRLLHEVRDFHRAIVDDLSRVDDPVVGDLLRADLLPGDHWVAEPAIGVPEL